MSLMLFEGAAGTGKTTRLLEEARSYLKEFPPETDQRALALTKFHGSRRRLESKLTGRDGVGHPVECLTIDSFAWDLVRRWRGLLKHLGVVVVKGDFQSITSAAGQLLQQPGVGPWVSRRYPLVVVDELQDCKGGELSLLQGLVSHTRFLCAADAFQDLSGATDNEAIAWATITGEVVPLQNVHRTSIRGLRAAATALRNGVNLRSDRASGFEFVSVPKAPVGGGAASWFIKSWARLGQVAIISPSRPETSRFAEEIVKWVSTKSAKSRTSGATSGPFSLNWETAEETLCQELVEAVRLPEDPDSHVSCLHLAEIAHRLGASDVREWLDRERNVSGRQMILAGEVADHIRQIVHRRRAFGRLGETRRVAMTVHQAKNREFEFVIALWPLRIVQDAEQQRRLIYNAVTRAKRRALIIVEDPKGVRLNGPPFISR